MSTLLEMAEAVRQAEARQENDAASMPRIADSYTKDRVKDLCALFETAQRRLSGAVESVSFDPQAIRVRSGEHVLVT
jgi:hypothetical protein